VTRHLGVLLDWTVVDFAFLGIAIQQYISISRDLKRSRAQAEQEKNSAETGHPEGQQDPHPRR
jgi:hypothetical protein